MSEQNYPSYLIHYGIEGQKWGVRRFQNEDGTYTDSGLLRRKEQQYFVKEQKKVNRKFDKLTDKLQSRVAAGKRISDKKIKKAIELGTRHRALDYISKNPRAYLQARGLNKASKARNAVGVASSSALIGIAGVGGALGRPDSAVGYGSIGVSALASSIAHRKLEKLAIDKWMQRQYGDAVNESKRLTIKDLEEHGIKMKNKTMYDKINTANPNLLMTGSQSKKLIGQGVKDTASGIGDAFRTVNRTVRTTAKVATRGNVVFAKNVASGIGQGIKSVANGGNAQNSLNQIKKTVKNSASETYKIKKKAATDSKDSISSVARSSANKIGTGAIKIAAAPVAEVQDRKKKNSQTRRT